jgi:hypothetical protein
MADQFPLPPGATAITPTPDAPQNTGGAGESATAQPFSLPPGATAVESITSENQNQPSTASAGNVLGNAIGGSVGNAINKTAQFSQDIGEAANKTVNDLYGHLAEIPPQLLHVATDQPKNSQEHVVNSMGGPVALASYRAASGLVDAAKQMWESTTGNYEQSKQKFNEALTYFHAGDYKNAAASAGTATGASISMVPGGSMVGEPVKGISEGTRPGANLSKPVAQAAVDAATALIMGKAPEIMEGISIVPKVAGEVAGKAGALKEYAMGKPATTPELVGKVTQATGEDVSAATRALKSVDTTKVKTFSDLSKTLDDKVKENTAAVDAALNKNTQTFKVADLEKKTPVKGGADIITSPVTQALNQLRDYYGSTNDTEGTAKIQEMQNKAETGLTVKDINDIARLHGRDLNAYNASGELASGLKKQAAENTRTDVKDIVRNLTPDEETKALDKNTSDLITTRDAANQMVEKVQTLQNRLEKAGLFRKVGSAIGTGADIASGGFFRTLMGMAKSGDKTLNAVELQGKLSNNLALLDKLNGMDPASALKEVQKMSPGAPNPTEATGVSAPGSIDLEARQNEPTSQQPEKTPEINPAVKAVYQLPTKPAMNIADVAPSGYFSKDVHEHEWAHATVAAMEGFVPTSIKSHLHPDALPGVSASTTLRLPDIKLDPNGMMNVESLKQNAHRVLSTTMAGAAAGEVFGGIPFEQNKGLAGDLRYARTMLKNLGYEPAEAEQAIRAGIDRAKMHLTTPGISDTLQSNARVREENLPNTHHASSERMSGYVEEIKRMQNENSARTENERVDRLGRGTSPVSSGVGGKIQPGREGGNTSGNAETAKNAERGVANGESGLPEKGAVPGDNQRVNSKVGGSNAELEPGTKTGIQEGSTKTGGGIQEKVTNPISQKMASSKGFGTTEDPLKAGFILSDGRMVPLQPDAEHNDMIALAGDESIPRTKEDISRAESKGLTREHVIENEKTIRTRYRMSKDGNEVVFSVPSSGVSPEQVDQLKKSVAAMGRNGNAIMEVGDPMLAAVRNTKKEFVRPSDIEPMLREIGAHPEQKGETNLATEKQDWAEKTVSDAKKHGGGFVADLRTGKPTDTGFMVEVMPEKRTTLDHEATPKDLQTFYNANRQLFRQHPELRIGGYKNELNISAHTDDVETAKSLAKKLDQRSVWDVKAGSEIPTGGKGRQTKFAGYPFEKRMAELRKE